MIITILILFVLLLIWIVPDFLWRIVFAIFWNAMVLLALACLFVYLCGLSVEGHRREEQRQEQQRQAKAARP